MSVGKAETTVHGYFFLNYHMFTHNIIRNYGRGHFYLIFSSRSFHGEVSVFQFNLISHISGYMGCIITLLTPGRICLLLRQTTKTKQKRKTLIDMQIQILSPFYTLSTFNSPYHYLNSFLSLLFHLFFFPH